MRQRDTLLTALKNALTMFYACPTVLTCRTVSFEQHCSVCPDFPIFTLAGFDTDQRNAYIKTFPVEHGERYNPDQLIQQIDRTFHLLPLTANPLLLGILCYVVDNAEDGLLPVTRAGKKSSCFSQGSWKTRFLCSPHSFGKRGMMYSGTALPWRPCACLRSHET